MRDNSLPFLLPSSIKALSPTRYISNNFAYNNLYMSKFTNDSRNIMRYARLMCRRFCRWHESNLNRASRRAITSRPQPFTSNIIVFIRTNAKQDCVPNARHISRHIFSYSSYRIYTSLSFRKLLFSSSSSS